MGNPALTRSQQLPSDGRLICDLARFDPTPADIALKHQAWARAPGHEQQIALSCALQWDPLYPSHRADWTARNVVLLRRALRKTSPQALSTMSGADGLKFRLFPSSQAIWAKTDQQALELTRTHCDWTSQVVLTDPGHRAETNAALAIAGDSYLELGEFSPNAFSLSLRNGCGQPAWLVYADANAPGWHASVNAKPTPILTAYGAFKAVRVDPGDNQVRFHYDAGVRSLSLRLLTAMAAGWVAVALVVLAWLAYKQLRSETF